jgi:hypothetical protein
MKPSIRIFLFFADVWITVGVAGSIKSMDNHTSDWWKANISTKPFYSAKTDRE